MNNIQLAKDLLPDDFIQARRTGDGEPVEVAEGTVAYQDESIVVMGTRTFCEADGWTFEIISRDLHLPETLCEIDVVLASGATIRLMGRGQVWTTPEGQMVPVSEIREFEVVT